MWYTLLGQPTGLRVSTRILGTGMFGTKWGHGADPTESRRMFDGSLEAGGHCLDTADTDQCGASESLLGACVHATREDLILASKDSLSASPHGHLVETGNTRKAMVRSLEASLKRLHTDRLDFYWVHVPDGMKPIDDIMRGFDDLVRGGDVAERYGYVNRALPDAELDAFVDALATRMASFDKHAIAATKHLVNRHSLPPDAEIAPEWDALIASLGRPAAQARLRTLLEGGFHKPGDVETRLGYHVGRLGFLPRSEQRADHCAHCREVEEGHNVCPSSHTTRGNIDVTSERRARNVRRHQ